MASVALAPLSPPPTSIVNAPASQLRITESGVPLSSSRTRPAVKSVEAKRATTLLVPAFTSSVLAGLVSPIPTLPELSIRMCSVPEEPVPIANEPPFFEFIRACSPLAFLKTILGLDGVLAVSNVSRSPADVA